MCYRVNNNVSSADQVKVAALIQKCVLLMCPLRQLSADRLVSLPLMMGVSLLNLDVDYRV